MTLFYRVLERLGTPRHYPPATAWLHGLHGVSTLSGFGPNTTSGGNTMQTVRPCRVLGGVR